MSQPEPLVIRLPKSVLVLAVLACALSFARRAAGAPKDTQALKLDDDAINIDYLATKFGDAEKKLKLGLTLCSKPDACSPNVVAQLHRDLGIVYVVASRPDEAKAQFVDALKADPSTRLPKELATPEIEQVFSAAKGGGAPAPPSPAAPTKPPAPAPSPASGGADEIIHVPPSESAIMTPLPLYAELPEGMSPTKVQVKYRPFGTPDWKTAPMKKMKTGYGVELPCIEIGTTPGDLKYYIQAVGSGGEVLATTGTKNAPLRVPIKSSIAGEPAHLPGKPPPKPCSGPGGSDCPPEFPGCNQSKKGAGFSCEADDECQSSQCKNGTCFSEEPAESKCDSDTGCEAGQWCRLGVCASPKKNWVGGVVQQDAVLAPAASNVCLNQTDYGCFDGDGNFYDGTHALQDHSGEVATGFTRSTTRIMLAYDRVLGDNFTVGIRAGYAFGAGPVAEGGKPFFPAHLEARGGYWFGTDPFIRLGIRPYLLVGGGAAQFDAKVLVKVYDTTNSTTNPDPLTFNAWRKMGTFFATGGVGVMYAIDHNSGVTGELKGMATFPTFGVALALQLGFTIGL